MRRIAANPLNNIAEGRMTAVRRRRIESAYNEGGKQCALSSEDSLKEIAAVSLDMMHKISKAY